MGLKSQLTPEFAVPSTLQRSIAAAVFALGVAGAVQAQTYTFGSWLSGAGAPTSPSFATLTANVVGSDVNFTLDAFGLDLFTGDPFIGVLAVQGNKVGTVANVSGGGVSVVDLVSGRGPTGDWGFRFDFGKTGNDNLKDNETVSWTWLGGAGNFTSFAAHVQGIEYGRTDSAWYTSPVPEPATLALMAAGLGVVGWAARRQKRQA
jgi:PEP-CTERM motif